MKSTFETPKTADELINLRHHNTTPGPLGLPRGIFESITIRNSYPRCFMYGILAYTWAVFEEHEANIPYVEHLGIVLKVEGPPNHSF